ncbi:MAG: DUF4956 domain-containing protein [Hyphomonadaceae bacterium]|nr:DUF4956 domain-containing protein [Hyphomonadaceae bacterium]
MSSELAPSPASKDPPSKAARPIPTPVSKLLRPYAYMTAYYGVIVAGCLVLAAAMPALKDYAPFGGAAAAFDSTTFEPVEITGSGPSAAKDGVKLALSIIAAFALMLPVTWICMGVRRRKDVSQSFIQTILVLPMLIAGIVHLVHNSLALAFSLAGIVAGVRFRHTLKDSAETTYLFTAIGVGLACGVSAVEVAAIISVFFNYTVLGLWATEFGGAAAGKAMFSREWMAKQENEGKKKDKDRTKDRDEDSDDDEPPDRDDD